MKSIFVAFLILIICLGCSENDTSSPATPPQGSSNTPAGGVVGQWLYESEFGVSVLTIFKTDAFTLFQEEHPDSSVYIAEITEVEAEDSNTKRFNEINSIEGKYYIIDKNNDLVLFDSAGKIRKAIAK